jgi:hypothetical protein
MCGDATVATDTASHLVLALPVTAHHLLSDVHAAFLSRATSWPSTPPPLHSPPRVPSSSCRCTPLLTLSGPPAMPPHQAANRQDQAVASCAPPTSSCVASPQAGHSKELLGSSSAQPLSASHRQPSPVVLRPHRPQQQLRRGTPLLADQFSDCLDPATSPAPPFPAGRAVSSWNPFFDECLNFDASQIVSSHA